MADSEVHVGFPIGACIERSLDEVLLHWSAWSVRIAVEKQQSLWQLTVVQALGVEHVGNDSLVLACSQQLLETFTVVSLAFVTECLVESKLLDSCEEFLLEVGLRLVVVAIEECEHVLEHAACGSTGRNELHDAVAFVLVLLPCLDVLVALLIGRNVDAFAYCGWSFELQERKSSLELFELFFQFLFRYAFLGNLFLVFF